MSDIVERLCNEAKIDAEMGWTDGQLMSQAADEIERLRASNAELLVALKLLYDDCADYIQINNLFRGDGKSCIWNDVMVKTRAAIAKAEGHE